MYANVWNAQAPYRRKMSLSLEQPFAMPCLIWVLAIQRLSTGISNLETSKITPQGYIFLVDFGLAKTLQGTQATTTGARAMTPGYSPPEQYGTARTDQRSDIFSLGATLYAALTGATPEDSLARAMEQAELTPIRKHNPRVSKRLAGVVEKALEVRPDERYQSRTNLRQRY